MTKIAAVTVLLAGVGWFGLTVMMDPVTPMAHAAMLEPVWEATDRAAAVHVVLRMRTRPGEDFSFVDPKGDFMRVEGWVESPLDDAGGRARLEKSDRIYTFDGNETVLYMPRGREAHRGAGSGIDLELFWPAAWVRQVRNLPNRGIEVVSHEESGGVGRLLLRERGADTFPREAAFLGEFDRETELEWDLATKRLTALRRWVYRDGERVLFAETLAIDYLPSIDPATFEPDLPDDVRWGGVKRGPMALLELGPREVALRLFDAAEEGDRETLELLCPSPDMVDWFLANRPVEVYYVGEPFRAGKYVGVYVPYKVRFGSGLFSVKEHNLALRNDNAQNRWVWDGGI
jgi:hypothetical protein